MVSKTIKYFFAMVLIMPMTVSLADNVWCIDPNNLPCDKASVEEALKDGKCILNDTILEDQVEDYTRKGGYVENTAVFSRGAFLGKNAQICDKAEVSQSVRIKGDAKIFGYAKVFGNAKVYGRAQIYGIAQVRDEAEVYGNAKVYGNSKITVAARVYGRAEVYGHVKVYGHAKVYDYAEVYGHAKVYDYAEVYGHAKVYGHAEVYGRTEVYGHVEVRGHPKIFGHANISGRAQIFGHAQVSGSARVLDRALVYGNALLGYGDVVQGDGRVIEGSQILAFSSLIDSVRMRLNSPELKESADQLLAFLPETLEADEGLINILASHIQEGQSHFYKNLYEKIKNQQNCQENDLSFPGAIFKNIMDINEEDLYQTLINNCIVDGQKINENIMENCRKYLPYIKRKKSLKKIVVPPSFESSLDVYLSALENFSEDDIKSAPIKLKYEGSIGVDVGGLRRQFLGDVIKDFTQLVSYETGSLKLKGRDPEALGRIFARLITVENSLKKAPFKLPLVFYMDLLPQDIKSVIVHQMSQQGSDINIKEIMQAENQDKLKQALYIDEEPQKDDLMNPLGLELTPIFEKFKSGFYSIIDEKRLRKFKLTAHSLKRLVEGGELTLEVLKENIVSTYDQIDKTSFLSALTTLYENIDEHMPSYGDCSEVRQGQLLENFATFTTGNANLDVPIKLRFNLTPENSEILVLKAHTCGGQLDCPERKQDGETDEEFKVRLMNAIINSLENFERQKLVPSLLFTNS